MRIRKKTVIALSMAAIIAGISGTYGYFSDIISVTNHIATGDVNISLREYEMQDNREISYTNPKVVLPGDIVSKIPRITNLAAPCWVRASVSYENDKKELEGLSDGNLLGISEKWKKQGEYYYYTDVLAHGESVTLFTAVEIPSQWTEMHASQKLKVNIQADAIQAANFQPDFSAMSPWGNQEIELCIHEENGVMVSKTEKTELSVEFNGNAHKLLAVPDDFFANIGTAMPGDVFHDSVEVSNTTENPSEIFFHTGIVCQREDRMDLLRKLQLMIKMNGNILYSGNLLAEELKEEISLGVFLPEEKGTLDFTVLVPSELKNAYALRDAAVKWYFTVYEDDKENLPTDSPESTPSSVYEKGGDLSKNSSSVKTGDETPVRILLIAAVLSFITGTVVFIVRKGGKEK